MSGNRFANQTVLITGGASGIGHAVARQVVREGGHSALVDINARALAETALSLGPRASARVCDLTDEDAFHSAARSLAAELDIAAPDGLVNCAGVPDLPGPAEKLTVDRWTRMIDSHLKSTFIGCKVGGAMMLAAGGGSIVNLASVLSFNAGPVVAYGAAKAGIVNLTASLGAQWCGRGVRVNAVAPGWIDTPFLRPPERGGERDMTPILAATPAGRLLQPEEVAEVISFLLTPASACIVGTTISCDGGIRAACGWSPYGGLPGEGTEIQP